MAMQRIVLTAPWKLGLFVFMLVLGCGFGLIYAYLSLFGGNLDFQEEKTLEAFFLVCGGVGLLATLGYVSVVTQARPMERVMRGGQRRARLMRRFGEIEDPREVDLREFEEEPDLVAVLERWQQDCGAATQAAANPRAVVSDLAVRLQSASHGPEGLVASDDEMQPLVDAINELIQEARSQGAEPATEDDLRKAWSRGLAELQQQQGQLLGFASSVAASSEELSRRAHTDLASGAVPTAGPTLRDGTLRNAVARASQRIQELRSALEALAEEANRLAINAALQVSRLGESGSELVAVTEEFRSLSTRYQRLAADLRLCENDQGEALAQIDELVRGGQQDDGDEGRSTGLTAPAIQKVAMVLDQNAGGLKEIAAQLGLRLDDLRQAMGETHGVAAAPEPGPAVPPEPEPAMSRLDSAPVPPPRAFPARTEDPAILSSHSRTASRGPAAAARRSDAAPRVYDLRELGAVELQPLIDDQGQPIFDLRELGAVEL